MPLFTKHFKLIQVTGDTYSLLMFVKLIYILLFIRPPSWQCPRPQLLSFHSSRHQCAVSYFPALLANRDLEECLANGALKPLPFRLLSCMMYKRHRFPSSSFLSIKTTCCVRNKSCIIREAAVLTCGPHNSMMSSLILLALLWNTMSMRIKRQPVALQNMHNIIVKWF